MLTITGWSNYWFFYMRLFGNLPKTVGRLGVREEARTRLLLGKGIRNSSFISKQELSGEGNLFVSGGVAVSYPCPIWK